MIRIATPEPVFKIQKHESALSASDLARLHRALLWLVILFVADYRRAKSRNDRANGGTETLKADPPSPEATAR